jgi:hypothetical protein
MPLDRERVENLQAGLFGLCLCHLNITDTHCIGVQMRPAMSMQNTNIRKLSPPP